MRAWRPQYGFFSAVGDRSVQIATPFFEWRPIQEDIGHVHRLQGDRIQDCQRAEALGSYYSIQFAIIINFRTGGVVSFYFYTAALLNTSLLLSTLDFWKMKTITTSTS